MAWRVGTPLVALLFGSLLVVSAVNSDGTDLRPDRYTDLAGLVSGEAAAVKRAESRVAELNAEADDLAARLSDKDVNRARGEVDELRDPAGLTPRRGPGLRITLSDAPADLVDDAIDSETIDLNRFVVHQQDIQAVVNALWRGGASAVTIAGQRVISTTGIKCEGNAVQLQGVPYPQPYVIEAVGDPELLAVSVDSDTLVGGYRSDALNPEIQIGWSMESETQVSAPAYDGVVDVQYAEPLR